MKLLAVDTSTEACSCALAIDDEIEERYEFAPRRHTELILPMAEALLSDAGLALAELDGLAFGRGPGAFTGVRVGAGVIQGMALGSDLEVAPISTLAALARGAFLETGATNILVAIDARMQEVYYAAFEIDDSGIPDQYIEEQVCPPDQVPIPAEKQWIGVGSGWTSYKDELSTRLGHIVSGFEGDRFPHARDIAWLGQQMFATGKAVDAAMALPVYLRDKVAQKQIQGER